VLPQDLRVRDADTEPEEVDRLEDHTVPGQDEEIPLAQRGARGHDGNTRALVEPVSIARPNHKRRSHR
jgi:hypothetical protein